MPVSFPVVRLPQAETRFGCSWRPYDPAAGCSSRGPVRCVPPGNRYPGFQAASGRANLPYGACLMWARTAAAVR